MSGFVKRRETILTLSTPTRVADGFSRRPRRGWWDGAELGKDVVALGSSAEGGCICGRGRGVGQTDEELGAGGVGVAGAGHGDDAADVGFSLKLGFGVVAGIAGAPMAFLGGVLGQRIAALDHEAWTMRWKQVPS